MVTPTMSPPAASSGGAIFPAMAMAAMALSGCTGMGSR